MADVYVSQSEFARQVGCKRQRVNVLVRKGVIPVNSNKQVPLEEGKRILEDRRTVDKTVKKLYQIASNTTHQPVANSNQADDSDGSDDVLHELNVARRDLTKAQARLKEFEQLEREGKLVEKADVEEEGATLGALVREWMSSAPSRYSGYLEMKTQREAEVELKKMMQDLEMED